MEQILKMKTIPFKIPLQGAPVFSKSPAFIINSSENILIVEVSMKSKRCLVESIVGGDDEMPGLYICASENSVWLKSGKRVNEPTCIMFPTLKDWNHFCSDIGKNTLRICFLKK